LVGELDEERRCGLAERLQLIDELNHSRGRSTPSQARPGLAITVDASLARLGPHLEWMRANRTAWAQASTHGAMIKAVMNSRAVSRVTASRLIAIAGKAHG
jgi:hypothetical protein